MIRLFRFVALIEGISTLALFLIAMPLKYVFKNPVLVPPIGMVHGVLVLVYITVMVFTLPTRGFSAMGWARATLAFLLPFGTFLNDSYLHRHQLAYQARQER